MIDQAYYQSIIVSPHSPTSLPCSPTSFNPRLGRASGRGMDTRIFRIHEHSSSLDLVISQLKIPPLAVRYWDVLLLVLLVVFSMFAWLPFFFNFLLGDLVEFSIYRAFLLVSLKPLIFKLKGVIFEFHNLTYKSQRGRKVTER